MGNRRMFTKKVTDDDGFMSLSSSAQALYLHLSMSADDDGFSNQVSISMFKAHASVQDLQALLEKRYIYQFDSGVIVIRHWRMANALRKDRYTETVFKEELSKLRLDEDDRYEWLPSGCQPVANCLPQDKLSKDKLSKVKISQDNYIPPSGEGEPNLEELFGYNEHLLNTVKDWFAYKKEKRQTYKPAGMKSLLTTIQKKVSEYGEDAVIEVMTESMGQNYQGITWDRLKSLNNNQSRKTNNIFLEMYEEEYGQTANNEDPFGS